MIFDTGYPMSNDRKSISETKINLIESCEYVPELGQMPQHGYYPHSKPEGIIIHYTAGNPYAQIRDVVNYAKSQQHCYFFNDFRGVMYQQFDLHKWGSHAGKSVCPAYQGPHKRKSVSRFYVGIETACAGRLRKKGRDYYTWWDKRIDPTEFEIRIDRDGAWQAFTKEQEASLIDLCAKLSMKYGFSTDFILGHNEVSPGRKADPGGSLSMTMDQFRIKIAREINIRKLQR